MHPLLHRVPRLQMLAVFESAARLGSFTAAASELGMTQPAVSRQIGGLERAIGLSLFYRTANRVTLSPLGHDFLTAVQSAFEAIDGSLDELDSVDDTFLVAANPGFAQQWLLPNLERLQGIIGTPELRLRLFDRDRELIDEPFDVAVHLTDVDNAPAGSRILFEERVIPVAAPAFAAKHHLNETIPAERLVEVAKLHLDGRDRRWLTWPAWFAGHGVAWSTRRPRLSYNNYAVVMADAMNGSGAALAWRGLVDPIVAAGTLVEVGPELHRPDMAYQLVPGRNVDPLVVDRLVQWVAELTG